MEDGMEGARVRHLAPLVVRTRRFYQRSIPIVNILNKVIII